MTSSRWDNFLLHAVKIKTDVYFNASHINGLPFQAVPKNKYYSQGIVVFLVSNEHVVSRLLTHYYSV